VTPPMSKNQCGLGEGTHHFACECREAQFKKLVEAANTVVKHYRIVYGGVRSPGFILIERLEQAAKPFTLEEGTKPCPLKLTRRERNWPSIFTK
jgi:hypothetical protein